MNVWERIGWTDPDKRERALERIAKKMSELPPITPEQAEELLREPTGDELPADLREATYLAARGLSLREASTEAGVSVTTMKKRIEHARQRLGARNVAHLVSLVLARGLIARAR